MTIPPRCSFVLAFVLIAACDRESPKSGDGSKPAITACTDIVASFRTAISKGGACVKDADCACHVGIDEVEPCGGITDAATAKQLAELQRNYTDAKCGGKVDCAAWMCEPTCQSGRCGNKPP
jgi:hypothetical protein